ncbi:hypothetical protein MBLNU459_g2484t1 [Dothideomycetes sp. NU459]
MNFLDKVLLNYAQVMGMSKAIKLKGNNYSNASASFFIAVLIACLPNIWLLNRLPVAKWLSVCLLGWGITTACHAAIESYGGLLAVRILSGVFESGIPPALMLLSSQYFTRQEQAPRFAYWYMGMGNGQILGGLISFGFQFVPAHVPLAGWRIMFLVLGLVTVALAAFVFFFVPDTPMQARFLNNEEKVALLEHIKVNQTGIENKHFHPKQLVEGLLDPQAWAIFLMIILQSSGAGVVTAYSSILLRGFGYTSKESALLNVPSGVINIITTLSYAYFVRYFGNRWLVNIVGGSIGLTGAALLSFLPHTAKGGLLAAIYLINFLPGCSNMCFQWLTCNTAGHTKRTFATAGMNAAFAIANIIGPETFRVKDAPQYKPAKNVLVAFYAVNIAVAGLLYSYYVLENKRRDKKSRAVEEDVADSTAYAGLTDKENLTFRYQY